MGSIDFSRCCGGPWAGGALLGAAAYGLWNTRRSCCARRWMRSPGALFHGPRFDGGNAPTQQRHQRSRREHAKHTFQADGSSEPRLAPGTHGELPATGLLMDVARYPLSVAEGEDGKPTGSVASHSRRMANRSRRKPRPPAKAGRIRCIVLRLDQVPDPVAHDFHLFANRVRVWIDKIDAQWEAQEEARRLREQEEASRAKGLEQTLC